MANLTPAKLILLESEEKKNKIILKYINKRIDPIVRKGHIYFSEITTVSAANKCHCSPNCHAQKFPHFVIPPNKKFFGDVKQMISFLDGLIEAVPTKKEIIDPEKQAQDYIRDAIFDGVTRQGKELVVKQDQDESFGEGMDANVIMQKVAEQQQSRESKTQNNSLTLKYTPKINENAPESKIQPLTRGAERDDDDYEKFPEIKSDTRHNNTGYDDDGVMAALKSSIRQSPGNDVDNNMVLSMFEKLNGSDGF